MNKYKKPKKAELENLKTHFQLNFNQIGKNDQTTPELESTKIRTGGRTKQVNT